MRATIIVLLRRNRVAALSVLDVLAWCGALYLAVALRLDTVVLAWTPTMSGADARVPILGVLAVGAVASIAHLAFAWVLKLHQGRNAIGGFEEMVALGAVVVGAGVVAAMVNGFAVLMVPRTAVISGTVIAFVFCAWPRALWRTTVAQARPAPAGGSMVPIIVAGAGEAGRELVRSMQRDAHQHWDPVAYVDDDVRKKHFRHRGVAVRGTTRDLERIVATTRARALVIAMPSADSTSITRIYDLARAADLEVKVLPGVHELLDGRVSHTDVRDISPLDLLGRHQVETDVSGIADFLTARRVLVTGAGGSIGSELCRQIVQFDPERLVMLDRDESALHSLTLSLYGRADLESPDVVLADIRDAERLREVFDHHRPDIVFHAAALKHVNMLEQYPAEALKTNVLGTRNVLDAAEAAGVGRFVNISTDKAAAPENALGYSKRLAEGLTAERGSTAQGTYLSVRFGNVLGTRGSVLTTFAAQIAAGGPVTVTDPEVTRFFMTVDEAVQLVLQAAVIGSDGEALVLDMGTPVRIIDVAEQMIEMSGEDIAIEITGLKPGEKLHEVLFGLEETGERPIHPLISHVSVPQAVGALDGVSTSGTADATMTAMRRACTSLVQRDVEARP
ncbi:nucleoside-diphosphate sugar epimerase/dehydratase [Aeromicrobium halocynthiae]|uniref:polysaccharide biosynthesis protein n=1 Tax=Aeromicrobium halocynthiae TaxID=560557 RepID=UPI0031CF6A8B